MRGVILNELDLLNKIIDKDNPYIDEKKPIMCLRILCKYYLKEGCDKDVILNNLNEYMKNNYVGYNENNWYSKIKGLVKMVSKYNNYNSVNVDNITITEEEWNKIIELNDNQLERVAFILLVYQKINKIKNPNSSGWISQTMTDIFKESTITTDKITKGKMLHKLYSLGYIEQKHTCDATEIKLNYIYYDSDVKININNFNNVISYYYEYRNNERWKECKICGKRFKLKTNNSPQKYCNICSKDIIRKNDRIRKNSIKVN